MPSQPGDRFSVTAVCGAVTIRQECRSLEQLDGLLERLRRRHYTVKQIEPPRGGLDGRPAECHP